jgi:hypothetical protein
MRVYAGGTGSVRVEPGQYGFNSIWTRCEIWPCVTVAWITTHSAHFHPDQIRIVTDYECHAIIDKGQYGFMLRVEAGRRSSNRFNTDIDTELEYLQKNWKWPKKYFCRIVVTESSGIGTGYDAGLCGWNHVDAILIPYEPGSKSGYVWL